MSDKYFVDTNILMYAHDTSTGAKHEIIADYLTWHVIVNSGDAIVEALDLEARYRISFWDALVVQAARVSGAEVLHSEDLLDGQTYGIVRVTNPL
jgi:predicted nucleic acid-binding protein